MGVGNGTKSYVRMEMGLKGFLLEIWKRMELTRKYGGQALC